MLPVRHRGSNISQTVVSARQYQENEYNFVTSQADFVISLVDTYMKLFIKIIIFTIVWGNFDQSYGNDNELKVDLARIIELSIEQRYELAESLLIEYISLDEQEPANYFFMAAVLQSKIMDYEDYRWEGDFYRYIDLCESYSRKKIAHDGEDKWAHFYLGSSLSYRAFYEGKKNNYFKAVKYALTGMSALNRALEIDSEFYDVYFGIGSFKYWRSKTTKYINWLPLIKDEREEGIKLVKIAAEKGEYTRYAAMNGLTWILIDAGQVSNALKWARKGGDSFPSSRFFLWGIAKSYMNLKDYENAIEYFNRIITSLKTEKLNNHYNEIICYTNIARAYSKLDQGKMALHYLDIIETINLDQEIKSRLRNVFKKNKELRERLEKS